MSSPLPFRPPAVVELIEKAEEHERLDEMKIRIRKPHLFLYNMTEWYKHLKPGEKRTLTKKRLIRRAVYEAFQVNLEYASLPSGWFKTLQKECKIQLYIKKSKLQKRQRREEMLKARQEAGRASDSDDEFEEKERALLEKAQLKATTEAGPGRSCTKNSAGPKFKKFIDLTDEAPPKEWLNANQWVSVNGKKTMPPRVQALYSTPEANYLYWDYNMAHWQHESADPPPKTVVYEHEGNRFSWSKSKTLEEDKKIEQLAKTHGMTVRKVSYMLQDQVWDAAEIGNPPRSSSTTSKKTNVNESVVFEGEVATEDGEK